MAAPHSLSPHIIPLPIVNQYNENDESFSAVTAAEAATKGTAAIPFPFDKRKRSQFPPMMISPSKEQEQQVGDLESEEWERKKKKPNMIISDNTKTLMRGLDAVASSLSQLTNSLDFALQGAKDLSEPSWIRESFLCKTGYAAKQSGEKEEAQQKPVHEEATVTSEIVNGIKIPHAEKAQKLAALMATKASRLAGELKSIKDELCSMKERCEILEEENRRLTRGCGGDQGEDDLVTLQMEALLAEKFRLGIENANLTRENQCLKQLVEYHQVTNMQDDDCSTPSSIPGTCLDFSSPTPPPREMDVQEERNDHDNDLNFSSRKED